MEGLAGDELLADFHSFSSVNGTAEATFLDDNRIDLITAGQAFHWFKPEETRAEFRRILKRGGWVVLVWNDRNLKADRLSRLRECRKRLAKDLVALARLAPEVWPP